MKILETVFRKGGIDYKMIERNTKVALFELSFDKEIVGYEVSRIYQNKERIMAGHLVEAGEGITGNEQFGYDGSKSFFPQDKNRAEKYFLELTGELAVKNNRKNDKITHTVTI